MKTPTLWLVGMSGPDSLDNLKALIEPVRAVFDGVVWTLHDCLRGTKLDEETWQYLESVKGKGAVIHRHYDSRHNESRNAYLWGGPIKQGDWCTQVDVLERLCPTFAAKLPTFIAQIEAQGANACHYYGKPFLFQYHESMRYEGNPHEGLLRQDGGMRSFELSQTLPNENDVRMNMRPFRRQDRFGWVDHYAKYYLQSPWGSNHCLLGNEARATKEQDVNAIYRKREELRIRFRDFLRTQNVELSVSGLYWYLCSFQESPPNCLPYKAATPFDPLLRQVLNEEKIVQDYYRYAILGDDTVVDDHTWPDMKVYT